ncbi:hypothetical protein O3P69_004872 [Scylla paramamosain]|uniref:Uncharacterized protein n=1 Tax=Scylla paramamosain TaxID=85552 RepID=A0AAW0UDX6_SCYPA
MQGSEEVRESGSERAFIISISFRGDFGGGTLISRQLMASTDTPLGRHRARHEHLLGLHTHTHHQGTVTLQDTGLATP